MGEFDLPETRSYQINYAWFTKGKELTTKMLYTFRKYLIRDQTKEKKRRKRWENVLIHTQRPIQLNFLVKSLKRS